MAQTSVRHGYFIDQPIDAFDHAFFGISGKEAEAMDPQQRLILEVVYEALEDAGIPLSAIRGTNTSVFVGTFTNDYSQMVARDMETYPLYAVNGTSNAILANRVSFFYNLRGPSVTLDTACSASLVGFHLGNESLLRGESDVCIVVGSALHFVPNTWQIMTDLGLLSADGRCRAFDAKGSGYVRGEGVCAVVLKRRADAESDGDRLRSIVRATGTNHDGTKSAVGLPSAESQERLLRATYRKARLNPDDTQFFEAHGTGTKAGDPREARAIGSVFATPSRTEPLLLGSVKTNIGHLEGAAGLIGVIKAVLALERQIIPPNMLFEDPNPEILFKDWKIDVPTTEKPWTVKDGNPRRASVNSFGYGGANAHVILEEHPGKQADSLELIQPPAVTSDSQSDDLVVLDHQQRPYLLPLDTHSEPAGAKAANLLGDWLQNRTHTSLADLAYTLTTRRTPHELRSYIVGASLHQAAHQLSDSEKPLPWTSAGQAGASPRIAFIFTGQGAQSSTMGRQLIQLCPPFRASLDRADATLRDLPKGPEWSIVSELLKPEEDSMLHESSYSQPVCTALQLALVDLLTSWNVSPSAVCGHSSGEIAAAYAAGVLSFESAMAVAYYRGLHMGHGASSAQPGGMLAVGLSEAEAIERMGEFNGKLVVAAVNSPQSVSVSGDEDAVVRLAETLAKQGVFVRRLKVSQAFHSHHMDPLAPGYQNALKYCASFDASETTPTARFFSTVTGAEISESRTLGASYWSQNMVKPVRFADAMSALLQSKTDGTQDEYDILLEIGPHPALRGPARQILAAQGKTVAYVATLYRNIPAFESILDCMGQLHSRGYPIDLQAVNRDYELVDAELVPRRALPNRLYDLPPYSWNRTHRSWSSRLVKEHLHNPARHTVLGRQVPGSVSSSPRWRNFLRLSELPWLREHVFDGKPLFPGAGYISMAIEAIIRANSTVNRADIATIQLQDINIKAPMTLLDTDVGTETYVELKAHRTSSKTLSDEWFEFTVSSYNEDERFTQNCTGLISLITGKGKPLKVAKPQPQQEELVRHSTRRIKPKALYKQISDNGLLLGDRFALVKGHVYCGSEYVVAPSVVFDPERYTSHELSEGTLLYPTILDNCFQSLFTGIESQLGHRLETVFVPTFIKSLSVSGLMEKQSTSCPTEFGISSRVLMPNMRTAVGDVHLRQSVEKGPSSLLLELQGLEMTAMGNVSGRSGNRTLFFQQIWKPSFDMLTPAQVQDHMPVMQELFQFQHPDSRVLFVPSTDKQVTQSALSYLASLCGAASRFQCFHMLLNNSASQASLSSDAEAISNTIAGFKVVPEPDGQYGLIIALQAELSMEKLDAIADTTALIVTSYDVATTLNDWTLISSLNPGVAFRVQRSTAIVQASRSLVLVSPSSTLDRYGAIIAEVLKERFPYIKHLSLSDLTNYLAGNEGSREFLMLLDSGLGLENLSEESWEGLRHLLGEESISLVWVSHGGSMDCTNPRQAMVQGLLRVARNENLSSRFIALDVDGPSSSPETTAERICELLDGRVSEEEISVRNDVPYIPRVLEDNELNAKLVNGVGGEPRMQRFDSQPAIRLQIGTIGLLETLHFVPDEKILAQPLENDEVEIRVMATALNFRDIAATMGIVQDRNLGDECSGIVHRIGAGVDASRFKPGDRVVACRPGQGAHSTFVRQPAALCLKMPDSFSFSVAASWSGVLTTAYYALIMVARLRPRETILIHSSSGGVRQMAIQLAQRIGANVFTTCSPGKRDFLKNHFGLSDSQIFSSRDESFVEDVMAATDGRGVDVVLNSLAGKLLTASWDCIATLGRFVEIGKRDIHQNANLPMAPFRRNVMFASVDLVLIYETQPKLAQYILEESAKLIFSGEVKPAHPIAEYTFEDVEKAMRLMQQGKHVGKVVLVPRPEDKLPVTPERFNDLRSRFDADKVYLIMGGLGGLGTALAEWMVRAGARRIAVFSRSGMNRDSARETVAWLRSRNVDISVFQGDVTIRADVGKCINTLGKDLGGLFFAAMALEDSLICNMTHDRWQKGLAVKAAGIRNVHEATMSVNLDFFISFSSATAITGNKGQANYAAANAYIDSLMQHRRRLGLPGFSINIGAVVGLGVADEIDAITKSLKRMKHDNITEHELLYQIQEAVDRSLNLSNRRRLGQDADTPDVNNDYRHQIITGINVSEPDLFWSKRSHFHNLYANRQFNTDLKAGSAHDSLAAALSASSSQEARAQLLLNGFLDKTSAVLGVSRDSMKAANALSAYGLDSIVAVELRKWLQDVVVGTEVSLFDLMNAASIGEVVEKALKEGRWSE